MREFVEYLNTLHRMGGNNSNATAEANYNSKNKEYADKIRVDDDQIVQEVIEALKINHKVLLTGFAGDGKTTIANIVAGKILTEVRTVLSIPTLNRPLVAIKDLSEIGDDEDFLYDDLISDNQDLMIVSNTGTIRKRLLGLYERLNKKYQLGSKPQFDGKILSGIEGMENYKGKIKIGDDLSIITFNLVKKDNLSLAEKIFRKILDHPDWDSASEKERRSVPYINRQLLRSDDYHALKQMMQIYRRIYEYGHRLTVRNLLEHFSYTITKNKKSNEEWNGDIDDLFFSNFFSKNAVLNGMTGAIVVNEAHFGIDIDANWKRRIWLKTNEEKYKIRFSNSKIMELYENSRANFLRRRSQNEKRLIIIRMLYFLNLELEDSECAWRFLTSFLSSPAFYYFDKIQKNGKLSGRDSLYIASKIMHVIREYFLGMKIPESSISPSSKQNIYIAMSRNTSKIKQTAQVILDEFEWKGDKALNVYTDYRGIRQFCLKIAEYGEEEIELPLPFLDYLLSCHLGVMSDPAFASYRKRLDKIKDGILKNRQENDHTRIKIAYLGSKHDPHVIEFIEEEGEIFCVEVD